MTIRPPKSVIWFWFLESEIPNGFSSDLPLQVNVLRCVMHPEFSPTSGINDIALLELQQPLRFSENVAPVCLSK